MMKKAFILLITAILLMQSGCKPHDERSETIQTVKVSPAVAYGEEASVSFPGKVKAASEVNLSFRISGPIAKIHVAEGQAICKGQVLAEMDARDYAIQLAATEAEYNQVKAEAERIMQLYEMQSVAENDYDKAVSGLKQITAKYHAHKNALADTKLLAPFDGYVQKRYFDKEETVSAGMPVFSILSAEVPEVEINIPASEFIRRNRFDSYSCYFDIYPDRSFPLELISINQKANLNQLYTMRMKLQKTNSSQQMPTPGMSTMVTIRFKTEESDKVIIPITALFEVDDNPFVWVYDEQQQKVNARSIRLSEIAVDGKLVVSEGLKAGERVVSAGVHHLAEDEFVRLLPEASVTNVGGLL